MTILLELVAVGVLILLNAFFVAAEYGLVTARRTRIVELHHQGNRRAREVLRITSDPPRFIAAMQLGVTLTSLAIGALGEHALSKIFDHFLATLLAVVLAYLILTFLHVVIGELVPKGIALGHSEGTALVVVAPVRLFFILMRPLIWILQRATELVLRGLGLKPRVRTTTSIRKPSCGCSSRSRPRTARSSSRSRRCSTRCSTSPTRRRRT